MHGEQSLRTKRKRKKLWTSITPIQLVSQQDDIHAIITCIAIAISKSSSKNYVNLCIAARNVKRKAPCNVKIFKYCVKPFFLSFKISIFCFLQLKNMFLCINFRFVWLTDFETISLQQKFLCWIKWKKPSFHLLTIFERLKFAFFYEINEHNVPYFER